MHVLVAEDLKPAGHSVHALLAASRSGLQGTTRDFTPGRFDVIKCE